MPAPRLHWTRGRTEDGAGRPRAREWIGLDDAGEAIARVVLLRGPIRFTWREYSGLPAEPGYLFALRAAAPPTLRPVSAQSGGLRVFRAVALDAQAKVVELRPDVPQGAAWLACVGGQVVGRAALPLQAVRRVEAALAGE